MADLKQTSSEKILLSWVRQSIKNFPHVNVVNFSSSWEDGLAFNALIHSHRLVLSISFLYPVYFPYDLGSVRNEYGEDNYDFVFAFLQGRSCSIGMW